MTVPHDAAALLAEFSGIPIDLVLEDARYADAARAVAFGMRGLTAEDRKRAEDAAQTLAAWHARREAR